MSELLNVLPIVAGKSLGSFNLGMPIRAALDTASRSKHSFDIVIDQDSPFLNDIVFDIQEYNCRLCFDGFTQKLHVIVVNFEENHFPSEITTSNSKNESPQSKRGASVFHYKNSVLASPSQIPNLRYIYHICGPTTPGHFIQTSIDAQHNLNKNEQLNSSANDCVTSNSQENDKYDRNVLNEGEGVSSNTVGLELALRNLKKERAKKKKFQERKKLDCDENNVKDQLMLTTKTECSVNSKKAAEINEVYYYLKYPGMTFRFPIPLPVYQSFRNKENSSDQNEDYDDFIPFDLPSTDFSSRSPKVDRLFLFSIDSSLPSQSYPWLQDEWSDNPELKKLQIEKNHSYWTTKIILRKGLLLRLGEREESVSILIGASLQDVYQIIGSPDRVTLKDFDFVDTMRENPTVRAHVEEQVTFEQLGFQANPSSDRKYADYYYNYFNYGMDLLICGLTHRVKKFILHSNFPGHPMFGLYDRCFFTLDVNCYTKACLKLDKNENLAERTTSEPQIASIDEKTKNELTISENAIHVDTEWKTVRTLLGVSSPPLLVKNIMTHSDKTEIADFNDDIVVRKYYGYPGIAIEIFKKRWIASITVF